MTIHATAIIDPKAELGADVTIGPFCNIEGDVKIGPGSKIGANVSIKSAQIGENCNIGTGTIIGGTPQILNFKEVHSFVLIGKNSFIGEYVTIHRSSKAGEATSIGENSYIMTYAHIAHDCRLENNVILTSYSGLSGHVHIEQNAVIGGHSGIHQFVRVGEFSMIGGMTRLVKDAPPYFISEGNPASLRGINIVGLKRNNFSQEKIATLKRALRTLKSKQLNTSEALKRVVAEQEGTEIKKLVSFYGNSKRGVTI